MPRDTPTWQLSSITEIEVHLSTTQIVSTLQILTRFAERLHNSAIGQIQSSHFIALAFHKGLFTPLGISPLAYLGPLRWNSRLCSLWGTFCFDEC